MKRKAILLIGALFITGAALGQDVSFYDYVVKDINGEDYPLSVLVGKK